MSYLLRSRIVATGHQAATVDAGGSLNSVAVTCAAVAKATDTILVSLDLNGGAGGMLSASETPYIYAVTDASGFTVACAVDNADALDRTVFINWTVLR